MVREQQESWNGAKGEAEKRKRDEGPDILKPQIQALEAMDDALEQDNTSQLIEAWRFNLASMHRQCPVCQKKKGNCHIDTTPPKPTLPGVQTCVETLRN